MSLPDLSTCHAVEVTKEKSLVLIFEGYEYVFYRPHTNMIWGTGGEKKPGTKERRATKTERAQVVAACLIHDIVAEIPF